MTKRILFILTGGTISAQDSKQGLVAGTINQELTDILASSTLDFSYELTNLFSIDSTNMQPENWLQIAQVIQDQYNLFDGFIIVHGTDTMAYGAAALSYLIQNSEKPIVFTGSQVPLSKIGNDGVKNILDAVTYAISDDAYAVSIVFHGEVLLGTRSRKVRSRSYQAFQTIDFANRAVVRSQKVLPILRRENDLASVQFYHHLNPRVGLIKLTPGLPAKVIEAYSQMTDVIIIEGFGIGGIPQLEQLDYAGQIRLAVSRGTYVILTTQVPMEGADYEVYAVGQSILGEKHIIETANITSEALVMKAMWALGNATDFAQFKTMIQQPVDYDYLK
ncbi:asparaginase [Aerococcus sp. HMSC10H05]|uniref:asparaginase n=1 Tax=Aerococcus sp. HMSC10H05 TaxID=1581084 RepID=UPI0008A45CFE|nr:asparaginase [Aerococcus sp. HMSC10H05]OFU50708.1 L-asparaginase 1 [Aerococcus sp. HMSC10H05]